MPLSAWSHTGFFEKKHTNKLSAYDELQLSISDATKEAVLEGNGCQYDVKEGIVTIAYLQEFDLPADAVDDDSTTNNLVVIANPPAIGTMLVFQLTPEQNTEIASALQSGSVGQALIRLAFNVGVNAPLPELLQRLYGISKLNTDWSSVVRPLFVELINEGKHTMHEIMQSNNH